MKVQSVVFNMKLQTHRETDRETAKHNVRTNKLTVRDVRMVVQNT